MFIFSRSRFKHKQRYFSSRGRVRRKMATLCKAKKNLSQTQRTRPKDHKEISTHLQQALNLFELQGK